MSQRTEVIRDIPEDQKARIESDYRAAGATTVWEKQANGKWTVTATFPTTGDDHGPRLAN